MFRCNFRGDGGGDAGLAVDKQWGCAECDRETVQASAFLRRSIVSDQVTHRVTRGSRSRVSPALSSKFVGSTARGGLLCDVCLRVGIESVERSVTLTDADVKRAVGFENRAIGSERRRRIVSAVLADVILVSGLNGQSSHLMNLEQEMVMVFVLVVIDAAASRVREDQSQHSCKPDLILDFYAGLTAAHLRWSTRT